MHYQTSATTPTTFGACEARPRMLFLCQTLPFPPDGGVHLRAFNIMRLLAREFDIDALCFYRAVTRGSHGAVTRAIEGLAPFARVQAFPMPQDIHRWRLARDHVASLATRRVYTRYLYESTDFRAALTKLLRSGRYDVVHVDSMDLCAFLPALSGLPVVCTHHNVESALLRRRAVTEKFPLDAYLAYQAKLMRAEEQRWCGDVDLNVVVSDADAQAIAAINPAARIAVVPNGVDTRYFTPGREEDEGLVFVGGYSWYPNRDALAYFAQEILPLIRRARPSVPVTWVGDCPRSVASSYATQHDIHLTGYVDDVRPFVQRASCYVVPLRVGGGTRLKILDAWAMRKAVVSTSIGCEGLDAHDGNNIIVRDSAGSFAEAVIAVLENGGLRQQIGAAARRTAEDVYEWDVIGDAMLQRYRELAGISTSTVSKA